MVYYPCSILPHHFPSRSQLSPSLDYLHVILAELGASDLGSCFATLLFYCVSSKSHPVIASFFVLFFIFSIKALSLPLFVR
ncbi:uncharacterized protein BDW70DRAFT_43057 [Aspergillus foveolatus]|uniref:uncharacterized protein n=1 Tax=Aspergillus foveolatus TaxID=210207 RepID=UPI003CCCEEE1